MFGNIRLIPSFRVQQWLDHIDDIKCEKQSQNKSVAVVEKKVSKMTVKELVEFLKFNSEVEYIIKPTCVDAMVVRKDSNTYYHARNKSGEGSIFTSRYADSEVVSYEISAGEKCVYITISFDDYVKIQRDILVSAIDSYDKWIDKVVLEIKYFQDWSNRKAD